MTGLMWAVKKNNLEMVCELIRGKALINAYDVLNRQPLYFAIENKNEKIMDVLLSAHADCWSSDQKIDFKKMVEGFPELSKLLTQYRRVVSV